MGMFRRRLGWRPLRVGRHRRLGRWHTAIEVARMPIAGMRKSSDMRRADDSGHDLRIMHRAESRPGRVSSSSQGSETQMCGLEPDENDGYTQQF